MKNGDDPPINQSVLEDWELELYAEGQLHSLFYFVLYEAIDKSFPKDIR